MTEDSGWVRKRGVNRLVSIQWREVECGWKGKGKLGVIEMIEEGFKL